ncbi:hypothetical protein GGQ85_001066 [Nitrobacter vulgaris]|nr:hypothetical protein [Nitrobacter vulgaris]
MQCASAPSFFEDDDLARVRWGAVFALARYPFGTRAAELVVKSLAGMALARPAHAAEYAAVVSCRLAPLLLFGPQFLRGPLFELFILPLGKPACRHSSNERCWTCAVVGFFMLVL